MNAERLAVLDPDTVVDAAELHPDHPRCEAVCSCPDHAPERCPAPATERVSVQCTDQGCAASAAMMLLCHDHADDLDEQATVTRRPL
jgi:hypothetical protein